MIANLTAALLFSGALSAEPTLKPPPCPNPVKPGVSVGPVKVGMTAEELAGLGKLAPMEAPFQGEKGWHSLATRSGTYRVRIGPDKRVLVASQRASKFCVAEGGERLINLKARGAQTRAPMADCGLQAAAHWVSWRCDEHGVEFALEGAAQTPVVSVFRPRAFEVKADPIPPAPWTAPTPVSGCPRGTTYAELACDFFAGNTLLECYLPDPCMARLTKGAAGHADLHAADDAHLGFFTWARNGRSMFHRFAATQEPGTAFRVIFDLEVGTAAVPKENRASHSVIYVHGARRMNGGFILDLVAPEPKASPAPVEPAEQAASKAEPELQPVKATVPGK